MLVLSGPNLHRLGKREPEIYGETTLADIHARLEQIAHGLNAKLDCRQTNHEGELVEWLGDAEDAGVDGVLINPGAFTHYSYAIYDALRGAGVPAVEVHLSNPDAREEFRRVSVVAPACVGRVSGFGADSYRTALEALCRHLRA